MTHNLKILPQYYERVADGSKTFEYRKNRGFQPGDIVVLQEWNETTVVMVDQSIPMRITSHSRPIGYTGKKLQFKIGYVLPVENNYVIFSLLEAKSDV